MKQPLPNSFFIDKWCAKHIRKVSFCEECLWYDKCKAQGFSVSPAAQEHANISLPKDPWDKEEDKDVG